MNKIIKLDYEEFKELERKAKIHDEQKIEIVILEDITIRNENRYMSHYEDAISKVSLTKNKISFSPNASNEELADFIKNNIKEDINKAVDIKVDEIKVQYAEKEIQLDFYKQNSDSFVKVWHNPLYRLFHFFKLM